MFYLCVARIFFEITTRWPPTTDSFVAARTSRPRGRPGSSLERGRRRKEAAHRKRLSARPLFMFLFTAGQRSSGCRNSRFVATPSLKKLSFLWPSHPRPLPQWRAISGDRLQVEGLLAGAPQSGGMLVGKVLRPRQKPAGLSECAAQFWKNWESQFILFRVEIMILSQFVFLNKINGTKCALCWRFIHGCNFVVFPCSAAIKPQHSLRVMLFWLSSSFWNWKTLRLVNAMSSLVRGQWGFDFFSPWTDEVSSKLISLAVQVIQCFPRLLPLLCCSASSCTLLRCHLLIEKVWGLVFVAADVPNETNVTPLRNKISAGMKGDCDYFLQLIAQP